MKMPGSKILPLLLAITILVITSFQVYWLKQNYDNEKKTLEIKSGISFRDAVYALQAKQLYQRMGLPSNDKDSLRVMIHEEHGREDNQVWHNNTNEVESMVNIVRDQIMDSTMKRGKERKSTLMISVNNTPGVYFNDSVMDIDAGPGKRQKGNKLVQFLYGIDSARDTLKITDITKATLAAFQKEKLNLPFNILRMDSASVEKRPPPLNEVTLGFSRPVTYKLQLGNSFSYLFWKMFSPILFSLFLIGVTFASFVLLYRNLLQQRRLSLQKNDFISNVTHELKTPIATVNVALEAMKNFNAINDPERTREYLDISLGELQRLSLLVDKVLRISMFENEEVVLNMEMIDMTALVKEVASSMRLQFEKQSAEINIKTNGEPCRLMGDRLHLMSVVYNLFDNALKYSSSKPVINAMINDAGNSVELIFADNGIGVPEEYREKIFEKFFRVPHGDTHNVKGYGLGLSYVSHIIHQHRGSMRVESEEGRGSKFIITIPKGDAGS